MNTFKSSAELKGISKDQLFGHYGTMVGALLLMGLAALLITYIPSMLITAQTIPELIIYYLISFIVSLLVGILASGEAYLYLKLICGQPVFAGDIFYGFKAHPDKAILLQFVLSLTTYIGSAPMMIFYYLYLTTARTSYLLLMSIFCVIGMAVIFIINLMLSQVFFLLQDFPQYSAKELLKMSCRIMKGHKGRLFYISVSFLPLYILGTFSFCIAFLWLIPYTNTVMANFYMDLMKNRNRIQKQNQTVMPENMVMQRNADVQDNSAIQGNVDVQDNSTIQGNAGIQGNTAIQGNEGIQGDMAVQENAVIQGDMAIQENAEIQGADLRKEEITDRENILLKENLEPSVSPQDKVMATEGSVAQEDTSVEESKEY